MIDMERLRPLGAAIISLFTGEWLGYIFSPNEPIVVQIFRILSYFCGNNCQQLGNCNVYKKNSL